MRYLFVVVFAIGFCFANAQSSDSIAKQAVLKRQAAFAATIQLADWTALGDFLADDAVYVHSFGRVDSKKDLITNIARFKSCSRWENTDISAFVHGNTLILHSNLYVTLTMQDGTEQTSQQRATDVWVKKGKQWWLVAHQSTKF